MLVDIEEYSNMLYFGRLVEYKESALIGISENGLATSIVISYKDGNYRKVFYAKNLSKSCTMTAMDNTKEFLSTYNMGK